MNFNAKLFPNQQKTNPNYLSSQSKAYQSITPRRFPHELQSMRIKKSLIRKLPVP